MALRSFASSVLPRFGLRLQPFAYEFSQSLERTFATVADDVKYASSHEWAKVEGDVATVGISDFAQAQLGDLVYVELPEIGATVTKEESFGAIESVKAASEIYAPLSGTVTEVNTTLTDEPGQVNEDPFGQGWLMKIKLTGSKSEADSLLDSTAYSKLCEEGH